MLSTGEGGGPSAAPRPRPPRPLHGGGPSAAPRPRPPRPLPPRPLQHGVSHVNRVLVGDAAGVNALEVRGEPAMQVEEALEGLQGRRLRPAMQSVVQRQEAVHHLGAHAQVVDFQGGLLELALLVLGADEYEANRAERGFDGVQGECLASALAHDEVGEDDRVAHHPIAPMLVRLAPRPQHATPLERGQLEDYLVASRFA